MASVKHMKDNKYRAYFCVNRKRTSKVITAKSMADAKKQATTMEVKLAETGRLDGETKKEKQGTYIVDLAEKYMVHLKKKNKPIAEKTRQKYQDLLDNNILPYFRGYKVTAIGVYEVEQFQKFLGTPEARLRKKYSYQTYSQGTISEIFKLFNGMMKKAVDWDIIGKNPCEKVEKPIVDRKEIIFYTDDQLVELLDLIDKDTQAELNRADEMDKRINFHPYTVQKIRIAALSKQLIVNLAVKTAARRGEILGLRREDINIIEKTINYQREVLYTRTKDTYIKEGLKYGDSKTLYVNDSLVEMISNYFYELDKLFELSDGVLEPNNLLFMTLKNNKKSKIGDIMFPDPVSEWFKLFIEMHKMPPITFHKLRTSSLCYLLNNGMSIFDVAKIAGHSNTQTLEKYYAQIYNKNKILAANKFDKLDDMVRSVGGGKIIAISA